MLNSVSRRISLGVLLLVVGAMFALTANAEIKWEKSLKEGMKKAEETGKLVMLDFYTDWWGTCSQLDAETFTDAHIIELSEAFIPIKVNPEIKEQPENMEALRRYEVTGYPTIVFTSSDGGMISQQVGFITPIDFAPVIEAAIEKEEIFVAQRTELEKMPDDPKLNAQVALTYLERTQPEKAFPLGKKAIEQDPKNSTGLMPNLHNELGLAYATKGEMAQDAEEMTMSLEKAISHFKAVVDKYPKSDVNELAQYYLGVTYALNQDYDSAISVLEKLVHHTEDDIIRRNTETMLTRVKELAGTK